MSRVSSLFVLFIAKFLIYFVLSNEAFIQNGARRSARCADRSFSHITCDKKKKHCPSDNSCRYLPRAGDHKWWCCRSKHSTKTCPNSGLRPRNQHCLLDRVSRSDGKKKKALFCRENEMCFKAWWDIASGYGLCCKAHICHDGTEANGPCDEHCQGVCQKFQKYKKGILVRGKFVKKCCGKKHIKNKNEEEKESHKRWEAPFAGEEEIETK